KHGRSRPYATSDVRVDRQQLLRSTDKQPRAVASPKSDVRDDTAGQDLTEQFSLRADAMHPISCAGPNIAILIETKPVRKAGVDLVETIAAGEPAVSRDVEPADVLACRWIELVAGLRDVKQSFVGGKRQSIRPIEIICHNR